MLFLYECLNTEGHVSFIWIWFGNSLFFYCFPMQCFDTCEPMYKGRVSPRPRGRYFGYSLLK